MVSYPEKKYPKLLITKAVNLACSQGRYGCIVVIVIMSSCQSIASSRDGTHRQGLDSPRVQPHDMADGVAPDYLAKLFIRRDVCDNTLIKPLFDCLLPLQPRLRIARPKDYDAARTRQRARWYIPDRRFRG